ncbi:hypothetical protein C0Q70_03472 [Pomacea canaliculata]|uniref:Sodium-coupled monocarboxylate transporter 1 n=1 Tax=Pomacea canaliculata TaxID=400727 RepID=A0A2T7PST6_POMCA|nr:hypothetical protein C0Q70_03472 [Pomacea canaliculata]
MIHFTVVACFHLSNSLYLCQRGVEGRQVALPARCTAHPGEHHPSSVLHCTHLHPGDRCSLLISRRTSLESDFHRRQRHGDEERLFGPVDYVLFVLMLVISAAIGIFYGCWGGKQKTTKEFLMANRSMSIIPVAISILVSFMSAILILGTPAEMYTQGTQYMIYIVGILLAIVIAALIFVPLLYPLKLTSSFEYLEKRFKSRPAKLTGTLIMIVQQILYMGIASFAPSTALEAVTGFPVWGTIIIVGLVSTFYTTLGGMKAVVWTDVFQSFVMLAGLLAIVIKAVMDVGDMDKVWDINEKWDRIEFFDFNADPTQRHSFWSLIVGGMVGWTATYGCNQASVQRYCALPSLSKAKISVLLNTIGVFILVLITCLAGVAMFAYYADKGCDPLTSKKVANANQLIPYFVMEALNIPGLPGLFISCLFSGALSTMSSCLNALAAVTWEDFLKPYFDHRLSEGQKTWATKLLAVVGGTLGLALPLWISIGAYNLPGSPSRLKFPTDNCTVANTTISNMTTIFTTLTTMNSTVTTLAPATSEVTGIDKLYTISYLWYPSIGTATVVVVGLIVSFITGPMSIDEVDSKYLIPLFDRLFCCLPASWRSTLRCHKEFQDPDDIKADEKETEIVIPAITKPDSAFAVSFKPDIVNGNGNVTSFGNGRGSLKNDFGIASDNTSDGVYKTLSTQF